MSEEASTTDRLLPLVDFFDPAPNAPITQGSGRPAGHRAPPRPAPPTTVEEDGAGRLVSYRGDVPRTTVAEQIRQQLAQQE